MFKAKKSITVSKRCGCYPQICIYHRFVM